MQYWTKWLNNQLYKNIHLLRKLYKFVKKLGKYKIIHHRLIYKEILIIVKINELLDL